MRKLVKAYIEDDKLYIFPASVDGFYYTVLLGYGWKIVGQTDVSVTVSTDWDRKTYDAEGKLISEEQRKQHFFNDDDNPDWQQKENKNDVQRQESYIPLTREQKIKEIQKDYNVSVEKAEKIMEMREHRANVRWNEFKGCLSSFVKLIIVLIVIVCIISCCTNSKEVPESKSKTSDSMIVIPEMENIPEYTKMSDLTDSEQKLVPAIKDYVHSISNINRTDEELGQYAIDIAYGCKIPKSSPIIQAKSCANQYLDRVGGEL